MDTVDFTFHTGVTDSEWCFDAEDSISKSRWYLATPNNLFGLDAENAWLGVFGIIEWWFEHVDLEYYEDVDDYIESSSDEAESED
ncbi:uncharacterized protein PGRI_094340 [Penicillium griseofulvum]|uniref:Uncharacterized protein n=1 Tax=Penicillium patulum TaxID=5078 RepID=A0A135LR59_PENPA|nr:uncharacterized protein PGRI_094340 [Penicillium griseofulvum]KXG51422.1 hypothetical protein PGRI_094340 [Penicillium griseofulvum]